MMRAKRRTLLAHVLLLAVVAVWGATFPLVKSALQDCSPLYFNQLRMLLAFALLAAVHWRAWRSMTGKAWIAGAIAGAFLATGYELQTAGLVWTTPSNSAFLTGTIVILVPLLCLIPGIRPKSMTGAGWRVIPGIVLAFSGIVLLTVPAHATGHPAGGMNRGDLMSLACAFAFALHLLTLAKAGQWVPASQLATLQIGFCAICMTVVTPLVEHRSLHATPRFWFALVVCAVFGTAVAFTVQSWAQQHLPAPHTALLLSLEPVFAWITALTWFSERLSGRTAAGSALIFAGILVTEFISTPVPADGAASI